MFSTVEKFRGPTQIILGLIALTFIGFGANTMMSGGSGYIVEIGSQKISEEQINQIMHNPQFSKLDRQTVFQGLVREAYLTEGAKQMGIGVSLEALKRQIANAPAFQENGKFSQAKFNEFLKQSGITEDKLVEEQRANMALANLQNLSQDGAIVSDAQARQILNLLQATRVVRMAAVNPEAFVDKVSTDDATLKNYYESNKKNYILPQAVKFQYIVLAPQDLAAKQTVSEAEIKAAYEKSANEGKVRRSVQHILVPLGNSDEEKAANQAQADKILAEAKANPAQFGELAKKYSADPATAANGGNLGFIQQGGGLSKAFEDAAFALQKGQISELVPTEYGYHIIKLNDIRDKPNFEQDKAMLEQEIRLKKAQQAFTKAREELEAAAFENPTDLAKVAQKMGVKMTSGDEWVTKQEAEQVTQSMGSPQIAASLFSDEMLKKKQNSEPIALSNGMLAVVRVTDVRPETTETFEAAKEKVKSTYIISQARKLALDNAKQTLADLKTGEKTDVQWSPVEKLNREQIGRMLAPADMNALLSAKPQKDKPAYVLAENQPQPILIEVQGIEAPQNIDAEIPRALAGLAQATGANMSDALLVYLQREIEQKAGSQQLGGNGQDAS